MADNPGTRARQRLALIATIQLLPLEADVNLGVHFLSRDDFDRLPGVNEHRLSYRTWTKEIPMDEGVQVDLFTNEEPRNVVGITRPVLRSIDGGAA